MRKNILFGMILLGLNAYSNHFFLGMNEQFHSGVPSIPNQQKAEIELVREGSSYILNQKIFDQLLLGIKITFINDEGIIIGNGLFNIDEKTFTIKSFNTNFKIKNDVMINNHLVFQGQPEIAKSMTGDFSLIGIDISVNVRPYRKNNSLSYPSDEEDSVTPMETDSYVSMDTGESPFPMSTENTDSFNPFPMSTEDSDSFSPMTLDSLSFSDLWSKSEINETINVETKLQRKAPIRIKKSLRRIGNFIFFMKKREKNSI